MTKKLLIRLAHGADKTAIWHILEPVLRAGDTYPFPRDISKEDALAYWFSPTHQVFVAEEDNCVLGTYYIRPNQAGAGSHVANCGYMTAPKARGKGVAKAMCIQSLEVAINSGYKAMQFNFVVATNVGAIGLWQKLGFETMCRLPRVFNHPKKGMVDALVMFKNLDSA